MLTQNSARIYWCSDGYYVIVTLQHILGRRFYDSFAALSKVYNLDPEDDDVLKMGYPIMTSAR